MQLQRMQTSWTVLILPILFGHSITLASPQQATLVAEACSETTLQGCAVKADALLKNSSLVFPDTQIAVDVVCSIWGELTSCIKNFTRRCLTQRQRSDFDVAFRQPVASMSTLCQDKEYRKEYLRSAPCVKKVLTESNYCGNQYRFLIDHVSGSSSTMKQICCARAKFKNCILIKTPEKCDDKKDNGLYAGRKLGTGERPINATAFAMTTLDKSLAFVAQECALPSFVEADCPGINATVRANSKGPMKELDAAESGEQMQSTQFELGPRPIPPSNMTTSRPTSTKRTTTTKRIEEPPTSDRLSATNKPTKPDKPDKPNKPDQGGNNSGCSMKPFSENFSRHFSIHISVLLTYFTMSIFN